MLQAITTLLCAAVKGQVPVAATRTELVNRFFFAVRALQTIPVTVTDSSTQEVHQKPENKSDTTYINYLTSHYIVADTNFAKGERTAEGHYAHMTRELRALHHFLQKYPSDQLIIRPVAIGKEGAYAALSPYQQSNTQVVLSTKDPKKVLLYILILPAGTVHGQGPRILSWQLVYADGGYQFEDVLGNKGWEILLEGVKGR
jgi:hypothetical protein